jgi:tetratricopeptide (TPR) repeat protein
LLKCTALGTALLLGSCLPSVAQQPGKAHCTVVPADTPPANDAERDYRAGNFEAAAEKYKELLAAHPDDPALIAGDVQAELKLGKLDEASAQATAASAKSPDSAVLRTALGETLFRSGQIGQSEKVFYAAQQLDPCYARARLGIAVVARAESNYATSKQQIQVAHTLNQADPDIHLAWLLTLPLKDRIADLQAAVELAGDTDNSSTKSRKAYLERLERAQEGESHHCEATSSVDRTKLQLIPTGISATAMWNELSKVSTWGLNVEINGKQAHLLVDTGAGNIYIGHSFASRAGLKPEEKIQMGGIGDQGPQSSFVSHASSIKVGDISFSDCAVEVSDAHSVIGFDGLIGMDVFSQYLVTLDFPIHEIRLGPLPARPSESAPSAELRTSSEDPSVTIATNSSGGESHHGPQDRYIAPEMRNYTEIYRFGHNLLIPTKLNKSAPVLMMIDTGSYQTVVTNRAAEPFMHLLASNSDSRGIAGTVQRVYHGHLDLQFDHIEDVEHDISIFDGLHAFSGSNGTEVSGLLGFPVLRQLIIDIDYRDGLVNFTLDRNHGDNRTKGPEPPCGGCIPTGYSQRQ